MMVPVRMPGMADGTTWWNTACTGLAPRANAASRMVGDTALSAARPAMMMVGNVISASTIPPTRGVERGKFMKFRSTARPSNPKTMEGTAARLLMLASIKALQRLRGANSSR